VTDAHRRFLFDDMPVRGGWVRVDAAYRDVLARHDYPPVLRRLLGELLAAAALLANHLKFKGSVTVQVQSPGPLQLLIVECTDLLGLRAIAKWQGDLPDNADLLQLAGNGRCVITLDPRDGAKIYQGIVGMEKGTIADLLDHHMQSSAQLATRMWLAADGARAAGLLLQKLPGGDGDHMTGSEDWDRVALLGSTVQAAEMLSLECDALLQRLFAGEAVRMFAAHAVCFECACSEARVTNALLLLGRQEIEQVLAEQGRIEVACEFCNRKYAFDRARALSLFAHPEATGTVH
jgi:molecular chaperone Hsp33